MSKELKLRVGGKYLNREGVEVEITKDDGLTIPFYSAGNNLWYTRDGRQLAGVIFGIKNYAEDLVSEVKKETRAKNRDSRGRFTKKVQRNLVNEVIPAAKPDYKNSAAVEPKVEETAQASGPEGGNSYDRGDTVRLCRADMIALAKMIAKAMKEVGE